MQNRTVSGILWNKFLDTLSESTWYDIFLVIVKGFCWLVASVFLINTPDALENLAMALKWYDFAILKVLLVFWVVFFYPLFTGLAKKSYFWILSQIPEFPKTSIHGPQYMGIPIIELVDYFFTTDIFSRSEFCEGFAVSRKVFDDMISKLDSIGVFTRGPNNSRILSDEYSRSDITSIFTRASELGEIRPLVRKTNTGFTHKGSMSSILSRAGFVTLPLHSSNPV